jgi:dolichol-phosphate hexosyltransferase
MQKKKVCIILPSLNEESSIGRVIDEVPKDVLADREFDIEVLVVDGKSIDRTVEIAESKGARVIIEGNKGKAAAIRTAFNSTDADYLVMLDSDYTYPAKYIPDMLEMLDKYPVVAGSRLKGKREKDSLCLRNLIGNHILTMIARVLYRKKISDLCTGYWAFTKEAVSRLDIKSEGFQLEAEILTQLAKHGLEIGEIPIEYRSRVGKAKLSGWKDGLNIAAFLIIKKFKR